MREKDRRNSIRHDSKSMCELRIGSEASRGPVINYAEGDGIGIIIKNNQNVSKGAQAHITIMDTGIEFNAEIAWTEKMDFDFVRIGLRNIRGEHKSESPLNKVLTEEVEAIKDNSLNQPPDVQPEKIVSQEEASEPGREYVRDDKETKEEELSAVGQDDTSEKILHRRKWPYVLTASLLVMLLGTTLSLLHNQNKSNQLPQSADIAKQIPHTAQAPVLETAAVKIPSFRDTAIAKTMAGSTERAVSLPDFREDALSRFQKN
jgi:hypothetical protein